MKFKNKQKIVETHPVETPPAKTMSVGQLQDHLKNLQTQMVESQTKTVMLQGAVQMVELQIKELNPLDTQEDNNIKTKNGVN